MESIRSMPRSIRLRRGESGFTLVELVITIVVLAAGLAGILVVFQETTARSADPQLRAQARAIAEAYMEEILLQSFADPDSGATGNSEEANRADFDDVWDYDAITKQSPPQDRFGNPLTQLDDYRVSVDVDSAGGRAAITVRVEHTASTKVDYTLRSERAGY